MFSDPTDGARERLSTFITRLMGDRSQREFCKEIGATIGSLNSWVNKKGFPSTNYLRKLAEYSGQDFNDFLEWLEPNSEEIRQPATVKKAISYTNYLTEEQIADLALILIDKYLSKQKKYKVLCQALGDFGGASFQDIVDNEKKELVAQ